MLEVVTKRLAWFTLLVALPSAACGGDGTSGKPTAVNGADVGVAQGRSPTGAAGISGRAAMFAAMVGSGGARAGAGGSGASTRTSREVSPSPSAGSGSDLPVAGAGGAPMRAAGAAGDEAGVAEPVAGSEAVKMGGAGKVSSETGAGGRRASAGGTGGAGRPASVGGAPSSPQVEWAGAGGQVAAEAGQGGMMSPPRPDIDPGASLGSTGLRMNEVLGYYSGDWGELALELHGAEVWATYNHGEGTIVASLGENGVLSGWWSEAPNRSAPDSAGEIELHFTRSGDAIAVSGRVRAGTQGAWRDTINLLLVSGQDAPNSLAARFGAADAFKPHP